MGAQYKLLRMLAVFSGQQLRKTAVDGNVAFTYKGKLWLGFVSSSYMFKRVVQKVHGMFHSNSKPDHVRDTARHPKL